MFARSFRAVQRQADNGPVSEREEMSDCLVVIVDACFVDDLVYGKIKLDQTALLDEARLPVWFVLRCSSSPRLLTRAVLSGNRWQSCNAQGVAIKD